MTVGEESVENPPPHVVDTILEDAEATPNDATSPPATTTRVIPKRHVPRRCSELICVVDDDEEPTPPTPSSPPPRRMTRRRSELMEVGNLDDVPATRPAQRRRSSAIVVDKYEISYHPSRLRLYQPPKQRQQWGQTQVLPRVNWGDLFFDLFYVAAAYNVSLFYCCCRAGS